MNQARCPRCNSTHYIPDPSNGGAGRNVCQSCKIASPVAEWYEVGREIERILLTTLREPASPAFSATAIRGNPAPGRRIVSITSDTFTFREPAPIKQYKDDD